MKLLLSLFLLITPLLSHAEWKAVDENFLATVYIDVDRIRESSLYPQVWQLMDLKKMSTTGVRSRRALIEYDCKERKRRTLAFSSHIEAMAEGKPKFANATATQWQPISGDTVAETIFLRLCGEGKGHGAH